MIASATRVLAMEAMPEGAEGRANGFMTMSFHGGLLLGPPLGGLVIDWLSWRWIFFLLVPIGVAGTVLTILRARGRRPAPRRAAARRRLRRRGPARDPHTLADADGRPAQRGGAGRRTREHRDRGLRHRSRRPSSSTSAAPSIPVVNLAPVPDSDVRLQRPEPARLRHHLQHPQLPAALLHPGRAPSLAVVHGAALPVRPGPDDQPGGHRRSPHRPRRATHPGHHRPVDRDGRLRDRDRPEGRFALDPADAAAGLHGHRPGLLQHAQPDGDHRLGAARSTAASPPGWCR